MSKESRRERPSSPSGRSHRPRTRGSGFHQASRAGSAPPHRQSSAQRSPTTSEANYRTHPLWRLNKLWNIDKHRDVIAKSSYTAIHPPVGAPAFSFTTRLESTNEHGARLRVIPDDLSVDVDAYTTVEIAIYEPKDRIDGPLLQILEQALQAVRGITEAAEAHCF